MLTSNSFARLKSVLKGIGAILLFACILALIQSASTILPVYILLGAGALLALFMLAMQIFSRRSSQNSTLLFTATLMVFLLFLGAMLYVDVFHSIATDPVKEGETQPQFDNIEYLLRSLMASIELFMFNIDTNILDRLDARPLLKDSLSIMAALAFACTVAILAELILSRFSAFLHLRNVWRINDSRNHLYIFFGVNEPSRLLASDIIKNDKKAVTIFVDPAEIDDNGHDEWNRILSLITHKPRVFDTAREIKALVAVSSGEPADIEAKDGDDVLEAIDIASVRRLIKKLTKTQKPQLHIFFMSDSEERNIFNIMALSKDRTIFNIARQAYIHAETKRLEAQASKLLKASLDKEPSYFHNTLAALAAAAKADRLHNEITIHNDDNCTTPRFYCHARYNGPNRVIEDLALKRHIELRIVDSSHLAVDQLKSNSDFHPVCVASVNENNPGSVDAPFNALIVGFGEVGRDAFRFLYEFAAFANDDSCAESARRSPFNCTIVDNRLATIRGGFCAMMPAIFPPDGTMPGNIDFRSIDFNNPEFYTSILTEKYLRELNYVVISIGDNDEALALGSRIFTLARRAGADMSRLRIMVRCTDDAKIEAEEKIAAHYNLGYGKSPAKNSRVINLFGMPCATYTYDLIISDRAIEYAKIYKENYGRLTHDDETWDSRRAKLTSAQTTNIDNLRKLRRQESQDIANTAHMQTKLHFLKQALGDDHEYWKDLCSRMFDCKGEVIIADTRGYIHYPLLTHYENRVMHRLAQLEHLRWNAAHELLGYIKNDLEAFCNETTRRHNCLRPWHELDAESDKTLSTPWPLDYKSFDFSVVHTTIYLNREKLTTSPSSQDFEQDCK